jgi:ankyrin repeat protein
MTVPTTHVDGAKVAAITKHLFADKALPLIHALGTLATRDSASLASAILVLAASVRGARMALYMTCVLASVEIATTSNVSSMLRSNSFASRMTVTLAQHSSHVARWMYEAVGDPLRDVLSGKYGSLEINPDFAPTSDDVLRNQRTLAQIARRFLQCVIDSLTSTPPVIAVMCQQLRTTAMGRFPAQPRAGNVAVAGVLFLRLLCPSIVTPEQSMIAPLLGSVLDEPPSRDSRRILVLVSKFLQNLANGSSFREAYMGPLNKNLDDARDLSDQYLLEVALLNGSSVGVPDAELAMDTPPEEIERSFARLVRIVTTTCVGGALERRVRELFTSAGPEACDQACAEAKMLVAKCAAADDVARMLEQQLSDGQASGTSGTKGGSGGSSGGSSSRSSSPLSLSGSGSGLNVSGTSSLSKGNRPGHSTFSPRQLAQNVVATLKGRGGTAALDAELRAAIFRAVDADDLTAFQGIVGNSKRLIEHRDRASGETPLIRAASLGHLAFVDELLRRDADTFVSDKNGWTALHAASHAGHDEIVLRLLRQAHIDVMARNDDGNTPMHYFARSNHGSLGASLLRLMQNCGADVNARNNTGETPLHAAVWRGKPDMCVELIKIGAKVTSRNDKGESPEKVARQLHLETIVSLFEQEREATKAALMSDERRALCRAVVAGDLPAVRDLLDRGVTATDRLPPPGDAGSSLVVPGTTALHVCMVVAAAEKEVHRVLDGAAAQQQQQGLGNFMGCLELLLTHRAGPTPCNLNAQDALGRTALMVGLRENAAGPVARLWREGGMNLSVRDNQGATALHYLPKATRLPGTVAASILGAASDELVDMGNNDGDTMTHLAVRAYAVSRSHRHILEAISERGADASLLDGTGRSALDLAIELRLDDALQLLRAAVMARPPDFSSEVTVAPPTPAPTPTEPGLDAEEVFEDLPADLRASTNRRPPLAQYQRAPPAAVDTPQY